MRRLVTAIVTTTVTAVITAVPLNTAAAVAPTLNNASFEQIVRGVPKCWTARKIGGSKPTLMSAKAGRSGARSAALTVSGWRSGAAYMMTDRSMSCAPTGQAGHKYRFKVWVKSNKRYQLVGHYLDAKGTWRSWAWTRPLSATSRWKQVSLDPPALPKGARAMSFGAAMSRNGSMRLDDATMADRGGAAAETALFSDSFNRRDGLMTNEYAYWNQASVSAVTSPDWEMDSGSAFVRDASGWTGIPDAVAPNASSSNGTASAIFRLNTKRHDFGNVEVALGLNVKKLVSTGRTPAVAWDGVHIWLRYQDQYHLYYASVARRDGRVVIKKKCPGGNSNDGTYYTLGTESPGYAVPFETNRNVSATVRNNQDGTVTISAFIDGALVKTAIDTGVGCDPIRASGAVGIRGDNADFTFDNFAVRALTP